MVPLAKKSPRQRMVSRTFIIFVVVAIGFALSVGSLVRIQLIHSEKYRLKAEENQLQDITIAAQRGVIYDRNGKVLAKSADVWKVYMQPYKIPQNTTVRNTLCAQLNKILGISYDKLMNKAKQSSMQYLDVKRQVESAEKNMIAALMEQSIAYQDDEGNAATVSYGQMLGIDPDIKRYYPLDSFASTVIGFSGTDDIGRSGLELKYDDVLAGVPGRRITAQNGRSDVMPIQYETLYDAQQGTSLTLTMDEVIQRYLEKELQQAYEDNDCKSTYGIVMDVKTGGILAMASMPNYNLNDPQTLQKDVRAQLEKITNEEERSQAESNALFSMWRNPVISDMYEPGSVFKIAIAAAALEEGVVTPESSYTCTGSIRVGSQRYNCHNHSGHGTQTFTEGVMNSCNPFFITLGQKLGIDRFYEYFEAFGFTKKTGIDLPAESEPNPGVTFHAHEDMTIIDLASCSFGQSFEATPIQMISMISTIANGGKLMQPYLVGSHMNESKNVIYTKQPTVKQQVVSEKTAETLVEIMRQVVASGTGKNAYVAGYNVAGKTGTSEKIGKAGKYVASFACFAPAEDPRVAILIAVDEPPADKPHGGGYLAAPVAARVMESTLKYLNVEPKYTQEEMDQLYRTTPSVTGQSVSNARSALQQDFTVRVVGSGDKVVSQNPAAGQTVSKGGVIILYTQKDAEKEQVTVPDFTGLSISMANARAAANGINIKIMGNASNSGELLAYQQEVAAGETVNAGSTVIVYFKSESGVADSFF